VTLTATPFEVLIGAEPGETYANLKAAVNRGAGESTLYGVGTPRSELVSAASIVAGKLQFVARRYEADTTTSVSGAGLVFDPVTFAKELAA
jgi:hypothetical protein